MTGVEFAPLRIPLRRRLQTLAVLHYVLSFTILPFLSLGVAIYCIFFTTSWIVTLLFLAYVSWVLFFDRNTPRRGGRRVEWFRHSRLWHYFRDYFPVSLVKTAELDPKHNYIIGYHPHGILGCGAFCNFATDATGFSQLFPGIRPHLLTLATNFYWPFMRGYIMACGACDVTRESIQYITRKSASGNAAIIVIGGAEEALEARPGAYKLTLKERKGFVKMALITGAHLVPCFAFGENDLFQQTDNPHGSRVRAFQESFKSFFGFSPPLFYGRGVFNYTFGLMPFRHRIDTVVGTPIHVVTTPKPDQTDIDRLHAQYLDSLTKLFDQHKEKFGVKKETCLEFI